MAPNNLSEFYKSKGMALPSLSARAGDAAKAGIANYTGSAEQNASLLGYLNSTPNQGSGNVITADSLTQEKPIEVKQTTDTGPSGIMSSIGGLVTSTKDRIAKDEAAYNAKSDALMASMTALGDTSAYDSKVIKDQGIDKTAKLRDSLISQIESAQLSAADQAEMVRKSFGGTVAGAGSEISRIQRDAARDIAYYGIGLAAVNRDYERASTEANRLIKANSDRIRSEIEVQKFALDQLGTKLAADRSKALTLELKQLDREDKYLADAISFAKDAAESGYAEGTDVFKAVQDLSSGKISMSEFYTSLGATNNNFGNVAGYDITSYATDPQHEIKVQSIYDTLGTVEDAATADAAIKSRVPNSPVTGAMVSDAASRYGVDPKLMIAIMMQDSSLGTAGKGARTKNPGNVGNDDAGNEVTYNTWEEGVDAVAKWLSKHKSSGVYRGEFQNTFSTIANASTASEANKKADIADMKRYASSGDYAGLYKKIENTVSKALTGENKTQYDAKRIALPAIDDLTAKLNAYEAAGGKMGLLKGTYEDINSKLGTVSDPRYKALAVDLKIALQRYRKDMSGAAFSAQEAADYASVNPSGKNSLELNLSILEGMRDNFQRSVDSVVDTYGDDGVQYIRQYARENTSPNKLNQQVSYTTPSGNSFTIVGDTNMQTTTPGTSEGGFFSNLLSAWPGF